VLAAAAIALATSGALAFAWLAVEKHWPLCAFHALTGLHCPGCGTTRAVVALLHGDVLAALRFNAFTVPLLPVLAWNGAIELWNFVTGRAARGAAWRPAAVWVVLAAGVAFGILRNLPFAPFDSLAP
jgi:hypothetical protein